MISIGLGHYLTLAAIIFTIGIVGLFLKISFYSSLQRVFEKLKWAGIQGALFRACGVFDCLFQLAHSQQHLKLCLKLPF